MRILMLSSALAGRGRIEIVVERVIHTLTRNCHEVHIPLSGPSRLLRAVAAVPEGWSFTIIGDGPDRTALHHLGKRLGISHAVDWRGWQKSPWNTIRHASAFLFASKSEAFGVVLAESLAHVMAVIASDCPHGPRDIVQPGHNGWLYPSNDEAQLHAWVKRVVDNRNILPAPEQIAQTGHPFTLSAVVNRFEQALAAIVDRQSTRRLSHAL